MKLKVLGSGSSGNCYLLQNKNETLMLEAGIPFKSIEKGLDFNFRNVVGCLVSHEHLDHSKAIKDVLRMATNVYATKGTFKALNIENLLVRPITPLKSFKVGSFTILPFDTQHDAAEPVGFLIYHPDMGKLLFITDSYYCKYKFNGLNHIMLECNYSASILDKNIDKGLIPSGLRSRLLKSHFSLEHVEEFLMANDLSQCKDITLIHLSDGNSNATEFKTEIERLTGMPVYIAEPGLEIDL